MIRFHIVSLLILLFLLPAHLYAQPSYQSKSVPPPPNAASLGIYGQVPVSLYTGLPNISIPLHTIQYQDITVPISLSYHAQGIKVDQESSWIGLGWALNAGGVITRTTRNYDDIMIQNNKLGFPYRNINELPEVGAPGSQVYDQPRTDYEPDIFYYNVGGKSGKFILDQRSYNGDSVIIKGIPLSAEKISITYHSKSIRTTPNPHPGYWVIITSDGYSYRFETKEYTFVRRSAGRIHDYYQSDSYCLNNVSNGNNSGIGEASALADYDTETVNLSTNSKQVGAWMLNSITSPSGAKVSFRYDMTINYATLSPLMRYEHSGAFCVVAGDGTECSTSQLITKERLLKEIQFGQGKVEFLTEAREDTKTLDAVSLDNTLSRYNITKDAPRRLRQIKVTHPNSSFTKVFDFTYSYFNNDKRGASNASEFLRLKLVEVAENGTKKHFFQYDEREPLPSKHSFDKDHWGYYNGKWDNFVRTNTLLPVMRYLPVGATQPRLLNSSRHGREAFTIRSADNGRTIDPVSGQLDYVYMKAGILTKIIYPTKGTTTFEYEPNTYEQSQTYMNDDDESWRMRTISQGNGESPVFEIYQDAYAKVTISGNYDVMRSTYPKVDDLVTIVPVDNGSNPVIKYGSYHPCDPVTPPPGQTYWDDRCPNYKWSSDGYTRYIPRGKYKIVVRTLTSSDGAQFKQHATFKMDFIEFNPSTARVGGGLRIKRTVDSDGLDSSKDIVKNYSYTQSVNGVEQSSGVLMANLVKYCFPIDYTDVDNMIVRGYNYSSNSTYPLSNAAQGSAVGYSRVVVSYGTNGEKGWEEYSFINTPEQIRNPSSMELNRNKYIPDYPNPVPVSSENGFVRVERYIEKVGNDFRAVREVERTPKITVVETVNAFRFWGRWMSYPVYSRWLNEISEVRTDFWYPASGGVQTKTTTSITKHEKPSHLLPTYVEQTSNDGRKLITRTTYPADYAEVDAGPVVWAMQTSKHMHGLPIQQTVTRKESDGTEKVISSQITRYGYSPDGSQNIMPIESYQLQTAKPLPYTNAVEFPRYKPGQWNYEDRSKFDRSISYRYDAKGKLIQYQTEQGIFVTLIWGYESNYPVAEIKNASYSQVETQLGGATVVSAIGNSATLSADHLNKLNSLRTQLPNAQVTTLTFDPLLGMVSQTGPDGVKVSFEYDSSGRLSVIKDPQGNIIKQYEYYYRQAMPASSAN